MRSGRRCCFCFGLKGDSSVKAGQIAHLDRNPDNNELDNLAWLCPEHHDIYDGQTSQSKNLTINEAKAYRTALYQAVADILRSAWTQDLDVATLSFSRDLESSGGVRGPGIQSFDKDPSEQGRPPALYVSVFYKTSRYFSHLAQPEGEK